MTSKSRLRVTQGHLKWLMRYWEVLFIHVLLQHNHIRSKGLFEVICGHLIDKQMVISQEQ